MVNDRFDRLPSHPKPPELIGGRRQPRRPIWAQNPAIPVRSSHAHGEWSMDDESFFTSVGIRCSCGDPRVLHSGKVLEFCQLALLHGTVQFLTQDRSHVPLASDCPSQSMFLISGKYRDTQHLIPTDQLKRLNLPGSARSRHGIHHSITHCGALPPVISHPFVYSREIHWSFPHCQLIRLRFGTRKVGRQSSSFVTQMAIGSSGQSDSSTVSPECD
jgi:hypothetical protein